MSDISSLISAVGDLQDAVTNLTTEVNFAKDTLDAAILQAEEFAEQSQASADSIEGFIQNLGNIDGTVDIDLSLGTLITATLTGTTTLTFSGLPPSTRETAFTLRFAGIFQINLPAGTKFANGEIPVPAGALYELPCSINNAGNLIVYGVINDIKTP
jgi:hypothetical protein